MSIHRYCDKSRKHLSFIIDCTDSLSIVGDTQQDVELAHARGTLFTHGYISVTLQLSG